MSDAGRTIEAQARLSAPGQRLEVAERDVDGRAQRMFVNMPGTLPDLLARGRAHGDAVYLPFQGHHLELHRLLRRGRRPGRRAAGRGGAPR